MVPDLYSCTESGDMIMYNCSIRIMNSFREEIIKGIKLIFYMTYYGLVMDGYINRYHLNFGIG